MPVPRDLQLMLGISRKKMTASGRRRSRRKRPARWLYPYALETSYERLLGEMLRPIIRRLSEHIQEQFIRLLRLAGKRGDAFREDDWVDEVSAMILAANADLREILGSGDAARSELWTLINTVGYDTFLFNRKQWGKTTIAALGFEYQTPEAWWPTMSKAWAQENFNLISAATESQIQAINELTMRAVRTGMSVEDLARELAGLGLKYQNRIKLIAADQIGKLNGALTQARQTEAGIDYYFWSTAKDERVRGRPGGKYPNAVPSHWAMEGMICKWGDSSVYADPSVDVVRDNRGDIISINWRARTAEMPMSIPGEEIRCRCGATPMWESFLWETDHQYERSAA